MAGETGVRCPECCAWMVLRVSRFGTFWGCTAYPHCRGIRKVPKKKLLSPKRTLSPAAR